MLMVLNLKKITNFFEDRDIFYTRRIFQNIFKTSLIKACKLSNIKNGKFLFQKNKTGFRYFSNLIKKEIKIDFKEYKKYNFGKKDKDCSNFYF